LGDLATRRAAAELHRRNAYVPDRASHPDGPRLVSASRISAKEFE
jgi:hypothetical protein